MRASMEFRDRPETEVAILDALVGRGEDGMTVFEVRSTVEADIDEIETALSALDQDGLIEVDPRGGDAVVTVSDRVVPAPEPPREDGPIDRLLDRLPF